MPDPNTNTNLSEHQYLTERLQEAQQWYSQKSNQNRRWHKKLNIIQIVAASMIPFLAGLQADYPSFKWAIGAEGVIIALITALQNLYKFEEKWIKYRGVSERLKNEMYLFRTSAAPYDVEDRFSLLVNTVEGVISNENRDWASYAGRNKVRPISSTNPTAGFPLK